MAKEVTRPVADDSDHCPKPQSTRPLEIFDPMPSRPDNDSIDERNISSVLVFPSLGLGKTFFHQNFSMDLVSP